MKYVNVNDDIVKYNAKNLIQPLPALLHPSACRMYIREQPMKWEVGGSRTCRKHKWTAALWTGGGRWGV
jgi:hypothetical protein